MATTRVTYHVTPFGSGWKVAAEGRDLDVVRDNKDAALSEAKRLAKDEPLGQVIVHGDLHALAQRPLALAGAPAVGEVAAPGIQPLRRAVGIKQPDRDP